MISKWHWILRQFGRRLWVRATLFSLAAVATALSGIALDPYIPDNLLTRIRPDEVEKILTILASSMLAVTTFSLTTMVSAYAAATSSVTPRATTLLMNDTTTTNVLGTFIGSFLYSLVGIIALGTGAYGRQGHLILFAVTIAVIVLIVGTLLRWIDYLSQLGRVSETTDKVEQATLEAVIDRAENPFLDGRPLRDPDTDMPSAATPVYGTAIGYIQHIDIRALSAQAEENDGQIFVTALPGTFVDPTRPVAHVLNIESEAALDAVRQAVTIGHERSFDQDPRFGLCVLAEIASRALSPAMNDHGTAIDVIGRAVRILTQLANYDDTASGEDAPCPKVRVCPLILDDLFDDIFTPISRDGASLIEVHTRLQKAFLSLSGMGSESFRETAARHSNLALAWSDAGLRLEHEKEAVRKIADRIGKPPKGRP